MQTPRPHSASLRALAAGRPTDAAPMAREAATGPTGLQASVAMILAVGFILVCWTHLQLGLVVAHSLLLTVFGLAVLYRGLAVLIAKAPQRIARLETTALPTYSVIVPLYHEADMAPGLAASLAALDYPKDRLQVLIVLEADDEATSRAMAPIAAQCGFDMIIAPPGLPKTKPRACNIALAQATGQYVVVYDAEDRPHPLQLQEAAARFAGGGPRLACLQAPVRIAAAKDGLSRQFALEYAAQFEIVLPALARLGAPFPLGGTSNHFAVPILKALGGWDAWNVTEDADLGFRLARRGWRTGMLKAPTWESAPKRLTDWLPQRARWVKGYMQTWGVHMRSPVEGGVARAVALQATLGLAILSALAHGPVVLALLIEGLLALIEQKPPALPLADTALLICGWGGAVLAMASGARRAGIKMRLSDALVAPGYWALQSIAAILAVIQLCTRPHHWNKTSHRPPPSLRIDALPLEARRDSRLDAKGEASVRRTGDPITLKTRPGFSTRRRSNRGLG